MPPPLVSPLYYIAFVKKAVETEGCLFGNSCITEVAVNLSLISVMRFLIVGNIKEIALPVALRMVNAFKVGAGPLVKIKQMFMGTKAVSRDSPEAAGAALESAKVGWAIQSSRLLGTFVRGFPTNFDRFHHTRIHAPTPDVHVSGGRQDGVAD